MSNNESKKPKIKSILYGDRLRKNEKLQSSKDINPLLKYFPKYYRNLHLKKERLSKAVESKVRRLKIVGHSNFCEFSGDDEQILKRLFRTNRKTLRSIPTAGDFQNFSLCAFFPRINTLNLKKKQRTDFHLLAQIDLERLPQSKQKKICRSYGYFWKRNRSIETLETKCSVPFDLIILSKLNNGKKFLSSLKNLRLHISSPFNFPLSRGFLIELIKNREFLRHVTYFKMENDDAKDIDWELVHSLITCCPQVRFLSLQTRDQFTKKNSFSFDLSGLQDLQVLKLIRSDHFWTFLSRCELPVSLQEITLMALDHEDPENVKELCGKWEKLENLGVLHLDMRAFTKTDSLRSCVLPLLRAIPQLETLNYTFLSQKETVQFDLEIFLSEIEPLRSLKHLKITSSLRNLCLFPGSYSPQQLFCLSNLSSIEINAKINSEFALKNLLNVFLCMNNLRPETSMTKKSIKLAKLCVFSIEDFKGILNLVHSFSHVENVEIDLHIHLVVENIETIFSNFTSSVDIARNTRLAVGIYLKNSVDFNLTSQQKQHLKMVFGQFTVSKAYPNKCDVDSFDPIDRYHSLLFKE